jgi:hypothetical protein
MVGAMSKKAKKYTARKIKHEPEEAPEPDPNPFVRKKIDENEQHE